MGILHKFYQISGLKINVEKTKAIKFGEVRDSRVTLCNDMDLIWTNEFVSLGILYNISNLNQITELNLRPRIHEMENLASIWKCRNLTIIGKTTIIKTLMISKIILILLSLPRPSEESFQKMEYLFLKFLWQGKPPKFKTSILENLIEYRGIQYPNIRKIDMVMKASWIKRIYTSDEGWAAIPKFYGLDMIYIYMVTCT